jgi:hypothetical protein
MTTDPVVWSCGGGGVQRAAIAALIASGELPKPDVAAMADTGREASETWRYFNYPLARWKYQPAWRLSSRGVSGSLPWTTSR